MPGNYLRSNVESAGNILTAANYNAEHDNHITNATPAGLDDYSATVAEARTQTSPGTYASPSLATSTAGELERLRYQLGQAIGGSNTSWLDAPTTNLGLLSQPSAQLHIGLEFDGAKGGASSQTDALAKFINQGGIINALSLSSADVASADFGSTNAKFGTYSYSLGAGNILAFPGHHGNPIKGGISAWFRNLAAGDYIAYNPLLGIELYADGAAGRLTARITEKTDATESTKTVHTVQGSSTRTAITAFHNVVMNFRCNDEDGAGTDTIELYYDNDTEASAITGADIDINSGNGGIWFFGAQRNDPTWDHVYAASTEPENHTDGIWTSNGTPNATVGGGVLNIATTSTNTGYHSTTSLIDLTQQTIDFKLQVNDAGVRNLITSTPGYYVVLKDTAVDRSILVGFHSDSVSISFQEGSTNNVMDEIQVNTKEWHTYRLTSTGGGGADSDVTIKFYIDGQCVFSRVNELEDTDASTLSFGDHSSTADENCDVNLEYIKIYDAGAIPPVAVSTQGELDSIGVASGIFGPVTRAALLVSKVTDVFNKIPSYGITLPTNRNFLRSTLSTSYSDTSSNFLPLPDPYIYYVAGDGITEVVAHLNVRATLGTGEAMSFKVDIDGDVESVGSTGAQTHEMRLAGNGTGSNAIFSGALARNCILTPGLHLIQPTYTTADSIQTGNADTFFQLWIRKQEQLG